MPTILTNEQRHRLGNGSVRCRINSHSNGESTVQRTCCFAYAVLGASLEHQQASRRSEVEHSSPPAPSTVEDHGP
ncbi:hypothetical protein F443_11134 [Phytophthora nicotianae P1569]|uniref:Uncharacterized protein n=1 Tax=Phytophthora nicotianae P1569 TaxID=1317065 RepID=V9EZ61_PHYNI|nr:hypothetical protein F443_11134 [Phytophthora nicotianae P1569]